MSTSAVQPERSEEAEASGKLPDTSIVQAAKTERLPIEEPRCPTRMIKRPRRLIEQI